MAPNSLMATGEVLVEQARLDGADYSTKYKVLSKKSYLEILEFSHRPTPIVI